jgi:transcriptional/translational regulatory protein YebC/TACO1
MRATRLVSLLLLLQMRGQLTAQELAGHFEVSVRTIHRDVESLVAAGVPVVSATLSRVATTTVELDEKAAASALRLFDLLESHDDVQKVYANFQIADEVMQKLLP